MRPSKIDTPRLMLRPIKKDDLDDLHCLWTEAGVRKYLWDDEPVPRKRVESIIRTSEGLFETDGTGLWGVFPLDNNALIGFCGFWHFHEPPKLELLYGIAPALWNTGLATEAASAMINYGFNELRFDRIEASTDAGNTPSIKVMQKLSMRFWKREMTNGLDTIYYAISRKPNDSNYL